MLIKGNGVLHVHLTMLELMVKASVGGMTLLLQCFACLLTGTVELSCIKIKAWYRGRTCGVPPMIVHGWVGREDNIIAREWC